MIGVDWIAGLLTTAAGFDMSQNHVDLWSGKVHAVPTRPTRRRGMLLQSSAIFASSTAPAFRTCLWWTLHWTSTPKFTSEVFRAFVKIMSSSPIVGSAYHKNTNVRWLGTPQEYQNQDEFFQGEICNQLRGFDTRW